MTDRLLECRTKIERAKKHIGDLQSTLLAFYDTKPYRFSIKKDSQTGHLLYYLAAFDAIPPQVAAITGDILHNLRSALDHLAYQLVSVGCGTSGPFSWAAYPFFDSAEKYETGKNSVIHGMRPDAIRAIDASHPYKGGNNTLWVLHKLDNIDKHRLLVPVVGRFHSMNIGGFMDRLFQQFFPEKEIREPTRLWFGTNPRFVIPKVGDVLWADQRPDAKPDEQMEFAFQIALYEPGIIEGQPLSETIQQTTDLVSNLITEFEPLLIP